MGIKSDFTVAGQPTCTAASHDQRLLDQDLVELRTEVNLGYLVTVGDCPDCRSTFWVHTVLAPGPGAAALLATSKWRAA